MGVAARLDGLFAKAPCSFGTGALLCVVLGDFVGFVGDFAGCVRVVVYGVGVLAFSCA